MKPYYQDEFVTIYHGDCREILPSLEPVDLVLTDPPYGIGYSSVRLNYPKATFSEPIKGDDSLECVEWLLSVLKGDAIIWGANNWPHLLPFPGVWLCWDKRVIEAADKLFGWPFELAWQNRKTGKARIYRIQHGGVINADGPNTLRLHPTQKPIRLFIAVITDFTNKDQTILDPFMGSGTTLIAAKNLGRKAIGIEIEEKYCEIAAKRASNIKYELDLFREKAPKPKTKPKRIL